MGAFMVLINAFITNDFTLSYVAVTPILAAGPVHRVAAAWGAEVRCCYGCC